MTRLTDVFVPRENVIGREGQGLKIALTTVNTGRLALPAICVGTAKWATKTAREFASERVQWGRPIGKHTEIAFITASAFGLEAMLDVARRLAGDKRADIRIEAAIAKLYASELGSKVIDEQVHRGRGYATAQSLRAGGERPVPVEQQLREMRINRIFEGSTESMHLMIAREALDRHLEVAGEILEGDGDIRSTRASRSKPAAATPSGCRSCPSARARSPPHASAWARSPATCGSSSAPRASSRARRSTHGPLACAAGEAPGGAGADRRHRRGAVRDGVGRRRRGHDPVRAARSR